MGWLFRTNYTGKRYSNAEVKELIKMDFREDCVADISVKGSKEAYVLHDDSTVSVVIFENDGKEFGTKVMHESCHPYYYNCPKKWLRLRCRAEHKNNEWRAECMRMNNTGE